MKLIIGQFIRTPYGIRKIVNITKDDGYGKPRVKVIQLDGFLNTGYKFSFEFYTDEKIIKECKASYNIIDILEVGDYVNGALVVEIIKNNRKLEPRTMIYVNGYVGFYNEEIENVVTKEQFEQMSYKVGE